MSQAGRKPNVIPRVRWDLYLPATIAAEINLLLLDPTRDKIRYGARNELIEKLLRDYVRKIKVEQNSGSAPEISDVDRFFAAIEFELAHPGANTIERLMAMVSEWKPKLSTELT